MLPLNTKSAVVSEADRAVNRVFPVTVKLTREEHRHVTDHAIGLGQARSEWMRDAILHALNRAPVDDLVLAEVLGVRLLLVNVLRSLVAGQKLAPEEFDKLLDEISTAKHELAAKLTSGKRR